ncbi:MAG: hypothetical protein ABR582_15360 [Gemmatimonadaceae bacterium]
MAEVISMSFGNFGARFNGQEPRLAYNNSSSADDGRLASDVYDGLYGALGAANDGLNAIKRGVKVAVTDGAYVGLPRRLRLAARHSASSAASCKGARDARPAGVYVRWCTAESKKAIPSEAVTARALTTTVDA